MRLHLPAARKAACNSCLQHQLPSKQPAVQRATTTTTTTTSSRRLRLLPARTHPTHPMRKRVQMTQCAPVLARQRSAENGGLTSKAPTTSVNRAVTVAAEAKMTAPHKLKSLLPTPAPAAPTPPSLLAMSNKNSRSSNSRLRKGSRSRTKRMSGEGVVVFLPPRHPAPHRQPPARRKRKRRRKPRQPTRRGTSSRASTQTRTTVRLEYVAVTTEAAAKT